MAREGGVVVEGRGGGGGEGVRGDGGTDVGTSSRRVEGGGAPFSKSSGIGWKMIASMNYLGLPPVPRAETFQRHEFLNMNFFWGQKLGNIMGELLM